MLISTWKLKTHLISCASSLVVAFLDPDRISLHEACPGPSSSPPESNLGPPDFGETRFGGAPQGREEVVRGCGSFFLTLSSGEGGALEWWPHGGRAAGGKLPASLNCKELRSTPHCAYQSTGYMKILEAQVRTRMLVKSYQEDFCHYTALFTRDILFSSFA